jgi:mercuric ion transport protein
MSTASPRRAVSSRTKPTGVAAVILAVGGVLAGLATASCCALPILLGTLGLGGAWLFRLAIVAASHRTALLVIGGFALVIAAVLLWRQPRSVCTPGSWCAKPGVRIMTSIGIALGALLLWAGYVYV